MKIYTDIKTLKKAWNLLKELDLQGLLSGENIKVDVVKTLDSFLEEGKLNEFCQIVTKTDIDFEEMKLDEVSEVLSGFFTDIAASFKRLTPAIANSKIETG